MIFADPNRTEYYATGSLPAFALVLPGLQVRLSAGSHTYLSNMSRDIASGGTEDVFQDRPVDFYRLGDLDNEASGDMTPVLITNFASGDMLIGGGERERFFHLQTRGIASGDDTRVEMWPVFTIKVVSPI